MRSLHSPAAIAHPHYESSYDKMRISIWRAISFILFANPLSLVVPLSWVASPTDIVDFFVITDAGPFGLKIVIFGHLWYVVAYAPYTSPYEARTLDDDAVKQSRLQNIREFMGSILALICVNKLESKSCRIVWINDNVSALSRVRDDMSSSVAARLAPFLACT